MSAHGPHQLLFAVELVSDFKESQSDRNAEQNQRPDKETTFSSHFCANRRYLLEDDIVNIGQSSTDALQHQVQGLRNGVLQGRVTIAGPQRQAEVELEGKAGPVRTCWTSSRNNSWVGGL